jgi:glycosyltransferase involved in cell wall biosynthesis
MKIACITASAVPSSSANSIQAMKVCQALAQLGNEVTLLVPGESESGAEKGLPSFYGISSVFPVEWLKKRSRRAFTWSAVRRAAELNADLVYTWVPQSAVFALLRRFPVILEMHDLPAGRIGPLWYRLFLHITGRKRIMVITRALQSALDSRYGTLLPFQGVLPGRDYAGSTRPPVDVILAPNGVEAERFADLPAAEQARGTLGLEEAPTVLCAGHLYLGRGADLFLALAQSLPDARFVWAGGAPADVDEWRGRASALGLGNVAFTGFVPNERLPLYLAAADVLLMPYGRDIAISSGGGHSALISSPMKMFEYLAAGRPILASDLPVFREVLDERNAALCPPEDTSAWAEALRDLLANPKKRAALSRRAKADSARYTWVERARRALDGFLS